MMLTPEQEMSVKARGNVLLNAGAGTGKTHTLVERCVDRLLDPDDPVSLDQVLVVTFTEAAAAEMRQRIRGRLEAESLKFPFSSRLREQMALLDAAYISTLHGFCLRLVRDHACDLGLDPQVTVLDEQQAAVLAEETLSRLLEDHYSERAEGWQSVQKLILEQARGWDAPVRDLILRIHEFTQTRPDPEGWFARERSRYQQSTPVDWLRWLTESINPWCKGWLPLLREMGSENKEAAAMAEVLASLAATPSRAATANAFQRLLEGLSDWLGMRKAPSREPLERLHAEARFLCSVLPEKEADPLAQDWEWSRHHMTALLELAREFSRRFLDAKRDAGFVDFHDLEQYALRLLWDDAAGATTPLADQWRRRFRLVFVDEYQDINTAQDRIVVALSREGSEANRFLVGDVKQSIYRFRQADPRIFQGYARDWKDGAPGRSLDLTTNFRSREAILGFVNELFGSLMTEELGGVGYGDRARLQFGAPAERSALSIKADAPGGQRVEVMIRVREDESEDLPQEDAVDPVGGLDDPGREARWIGQRLRKMIQDGATVWDEGIGTEREASWGDMVILLRSPRMKAEAFAREFTRLGIPLEARRSAFFESIEVQDLLQLLILLDNPLQDIPLLSVLRSPLAGLSDEDLVRIRLAAPSAGFWVALKRFELDARDDPAWHRVRKFLDRFQTWRDLARQASLSQRLERVLGETGYLEWQSTQPRGEQRQANIKQLVELARRFDDVHRQGLHRFLRFIEAQREAAGDLEPAAFESGEAVRLMSIHQSKGLEFPIVVVADLGKAFNRADAQGGVLLDEAFGLCPMVRPPGGLESYPSLTCWLTRRRQRREALGEELRLLYVATTRARDFLLLAGSCSARNLETRWSDPGRSRLDALTLARANSVLDWIMPWLAVKRGSNDWTVGAAGTTPHCGWRISRGSGPMTSAEPDRSDSTVLPSPSAERLESLKSRLSWMYPGSLAASHFAKTSVTALRRGSIRGLENEAQPAAFFGSRGFQPEEMEGGEEGLRRGIAYHRVFERLNLDRTSTSADLAEELKRLRRERLISPEEYAVVQPEIVLRFWQSGLGRTLRSRQAEIRRELPFTLRLAKGDLPGFTNSPPENEFVILQGVVDLVVLAPAEVWVVDFKTDRVSEDLLESRVAEYSVQLQLYSHALCRIYRRPVSQRWLCFLEAGTNFSVGGFPEARIVLA